MASSSGTSSGSSLLQNSGSEEDLQALMDQRKRKRMISNRESARRSRMRKQKHLDDLVSQVAKLRKENQEILTSVNITTQKYLSVEAENSVLRAQMGELSNRLESLNEIVGALNSSNGVFGASNAFVEPNNGFFFNSLNNMSYMNQPIMASADILQYWDGSGFPAVKETCIYMQLTISTVNLRPDSSKYITSKLILNQLCDWLKSIGRSRLKTVWHNNCRESDSIMWWDLLGKRVVDFLGLSLLMRYCND